MKYAQRLAPLIALVILCVAPNGHVHTQPAPGAGRVLNHIGVVVRDVEAAARTYADAFGLASLPVQTVSYPLPDGSKAEIRIARVLMPDFQIEVIQPVSGSGPHYAHLMKFGPGVHHFGIHTDENIDALRTAMQKRGGVWTAGLKGGSFAYVDLRERLGATVEIMNSRLATLSQEDTAPVRHASLLGGRKVRHVGVVVPDLDAALRSYSDVLDLTDARTFRLPDGRRALLYPPGQKWNAQAAIRVAQLRIGPVGIELIQSIGEPTPWSDTLNRQRGPALQHLALDESDGLGRDQWLQLGRGRGGHWSVGGPRADGGLTYLDFSEALGLMFEY
jgi:catechol 2,3-dioxygenase-like lactoylglutathione lyase family enzyme